MYFYTKQFTRYTAATLLAYIQHGVGQYCRQNDVIVTTRIYMGVMISCS